MTGPFEEVTEAELSVLEFLWDHPEGAHIRAIVLALYGRHEHSKHGGVKALLDRLLAKGFVRVEKTTLAHQFFATVPRQEFVGRHLKKLADSHFQGSLAPLFLSLLDQAKISDADRKALAKMIEKIQD